VHYGEFLYGVDYRYEKKFGGLYRAKGDHRFKPRVFSFLARRRDVINNPNPASYEMIEDGIIQKRNFRGSLVLYADIKPYIESVQWYAKNEPHKLHEKIERQ
jgi:hypothetical protein